MTSPRRAVLYGRVSKADPRAGTEGRSVDQQLAEMTAQARRENVTIVGPFRDDGISVSRFSGRGARPGWQQTMAAILDSRATELWAWDVSRATRDRPVWVSLINACILGRVKISVNGRLHDPLDADDGFILDLLAALAVRESAVNSKRILRDVAARAAQGRPHGKLPYGYLREYDPVNRVLLRQVPDPETAPIVAEMTRRVLGGESMYAIAADLNARKVACPQAVRDLRVHGHRGDVLWRGDEVRDQLLSPTAAGQRVHNGQVVADATWPALITPAEHAALVSLLRPPGQRQWFGPVKHLLTGLAVCGVCEAPLRRVKNRGYPSYACRGRDRRGSSCVSRLQEPLDAMVTAYVVGRLADPALIDGIARAEAEDDDHTAAVARQIADLRARLAQFEESAAAGGISADGFGRIEARLLADIDAKQQELARSSRLPPAVLDLASPDAAARWATITGDVPRQRQAVRALVTVIVHRSKRRQGARGFDESAIQIVDL